MTTIDELPPAFDDIVHDRNADEQDVDGGIDRSRTNSGTAFEDVDQLMRRATIAGPLPTTHEHEHGGEELPDYEEAAGPAELPNYEERHLLAPVVSYNVYQIDRKLQILTPATRASFARSRYRITARSGLFSKKADYTLTRLPTGAAAAAERSPGQEVALINFDRSGKLPWMPRATVQLASSSSTAGSMKVYNMSAPNFSDWKFIFHDETYFWRLTDKPTALSLYELGSESIVARFTYSMHGTDATRGAEVGTLDIFGGARSEDDDMVELVLSTCQVCINHWKAMGRHYKNNITPRNCSVAGGATLGNSFFAQDGSGEASRRASNAV